MLPRVDPVESQPERRPRDLHREVEGIDGDRPLDVLRMHVALADRQRVPGLVGCPHEPRRLGRPQRLAQAGSLDELRRGEVVLTGVDLDGDGREEMVYLKYSSFNGLSTGFEEYGDLYIQSYDSGGTLGATLLVPNTSRSGMPLTAADFNGDGRLDVLYDGGRFLLLNTCQ